MVMTPLQLISRNALDSADKNSGRNSQGKMTMRYTGGGQSRDIVSFSKRKRRNSSDSEVIEYDPNRTAFMHC
jgi:large subunit ribosomal protein L2